MQHVRVAVAAKLAGDHPRGRVHMGDPRVERAPFERVDDPVGVRDDAQRPGGVEDVLRLEVETGSGGDAHRPCGHHGLPGKREGQVAVDDVRPGERAAEKLLVRPGEPHLLAGGDRRDERDPFLVGGVLTAADADEAQVVAEGAQLPCELEGGVGGAVARVAHVIADEHDRQRPVVLVRHVPSLLCRSSRRPPAGRLATVI